MAQIETQTTGQPRRATRRDWIGLAVIALPCLLYAMDLTVLTLGLYGISRPQAATYSIALYVIAYVPKLVLGAILAAADPTWRPSMDWSSRA